MIYAALLALEAVSGFHGAEAIHAQPWLTSADYSSEAIWKLEEGGFRVALSIDPLGRPHSCAILLAPASKSLKAKICPLLLKRARFVPARDEQGRAVDAVDTTSISVAIDKKFFKSYDLEIPVNKLPDAKKLAEVTIDQLVEAGGSVTGGHASKSSGSSQLDELACRSANEMPIARVEDRNGRLNKAVVRQVILFRVH
jgi:hypothetical protein